MPGARPVKPRDGDYGREGRAPWLDVDWQAAQRRLEIDGHEVNYCELGEGPAILFVHGLGASWQSWLEQMPEFAASHRVVAMDTPTSSGAAPVPSRLVLADGVARIERR